MAYPSRHGLRRLPHESNFVRESNTCFPSMRRLRGEIRSIGPSNYPNRSQGKLPSCLTISFETGINMNHVSNGTSDFHAGDNTPSPVTRIIALGFYDGPT